MKPTVEQLLERCPGADLAFVERHLSSVSERYFDCFDLDEIVQHIEGLGRLTIEQPVVTVIRSEDDGWFECTFLAFDYPGEFSLLAGALSGLGFSIHAGDVFTYARSQPEVTGRQTIRRLLSRRGVFRTRGQAPAATRRLVVDRFYGYVGDDIDAKAWADRTRENVGEIISMVEQGETDAARNRVNELVTRRLETLRSDGLGVLAPISLELANDAGPFTRLVVNSEDTPAFLYSLSNALTLRGVSIERVEIRTIGSRIEDTIDFVDRSGARIEDVEALDRIRLSVLLTKQFTYFLPSAPDPYAALRRFDSLLDDILESPERGHWVDLFSQQRNLEGLARLLGASTFVWEDFIRVQRDALLPMLEVEGERAPLFERDTVEERLRRILAAADTYEEKRDALNAFKDREIFLIDMDHIVQAGPSDPRSLAENLTRVAEAVLGQAFAIVMDRLRSMHGVPRTVGGLETQCAMLGLGKMGGVALGYASDIELLFVYADSGRTDGAEPLTNQEFFVRFVKEFRDFIRAKREGVFDLDLRLRPFGADGPLACSLEAFCRYFGPTGEAHAYERLALVRLRAIGGDRVLGAQVQRLRDEFIYAAPSIDTEAIRDLRRRQYEELTDGQLNAKFSPGALVDLEYDVQILQITHAERASALKTPRIHEALEALSAVGILGEHEGARLVRAYYFLRRLINALRMLRGNAKDLFLPPEDADEFRHLARRMGYQREGGLERSQQLSLDFETQTAAIRAFVERHFGRDALPGVGVGNVADLVLSDSDPPDDLRDRILTAAGFADTHRAAVNLRRLAGVGASRERFARLAVLACDMIRDKADPDMALNNWERFVDALDDRKEHFDTLLAQPRRLDILLSVFADSQFLADTLARNPEFFNWATSPDNLNRCLEREGLLAELRELSEQCGEQDEWLNAIRRYRRRGILGIGARDLCLAAPTEDVTRDLSTLAESLIQATLERYWRDCSSEGSDSTDLGERFCVLAFGKLGGRELNYSSDIDLIGVFDGDPAPEFGPALERIRADLSSHTIEGHAYRVDLRLRAYGSAGELVHSIDALEAYYRDHAALWETQALLKVRPIAGNLRVGEALLGRLAFAFEKGLERANVVDSIRRLRAEAVSRSQRQSRSVASPGSSPLRSLDVKDGAGGIRDVEFLTQGIQLTHVAEHAELIEGNTLNALAALRRLEILPAEVAGELADDYVFLRRVEHFLQILDDRQTHTLPSNPADVTALGRRVLGSDYDGKAFITHIVERMERVRDVYEEFLSMTDRETSS